MTTINMTFRDSALAKTISPTFIHATMLHDGRMLLELLNGHYSSLAFAECSVKDQDGVAQILLTWTRSTFTQEQPRTAATQNLSTSYAQGYLISLSDQPSLDLRRHIPWRTDTSVDFKQAFSGKPTKIEDAKVQRYCQTIADNLKTFYVTAQEKARLRLLGGHYRRVMDEYLKIMKSKTTVSDQNYYQAWSKGIGAIIANERYLLLAQSDPDRSKYLKLTAEASNLYNWYMDLARAGVSRSR
ncbi:hypothetical protein V5R04_08090 [Jonesiaceae bacterium BS-20]|uniref:Uncharacterized protein n=1 Tax=Jonesiaceae bacterium BS-20 TaxID=3120821 RepID=A0AAU7DTA1_9MICO